jgi:hypothetical protein
MPELRSVFLAGSRIVGRLGLQIAGSVAAAVLVAELIGPLPFGAPPSEPVLARRDVPAASPFVAPAEPTVPEFPLSARWTQPSLMILASSEAEDFPMELDAGFEPSLSRPYVMLAGSDWPSAAPARKPAPAVEKPAKAQPRTVVASAAPAPRPIPLPPPAPRGSVDAVIEPPPVPVATAAPVAAPGPFDMVRQGAVRMVPSLDDIVGGVNSAANAVMKLARLD